MCGMQVKKTFLRTAPSKKTDSYDLLKIELKNKIQYNPSVKKVTSRVYVIIIVKPHVKWNVKKIKLRVHSEVGRVQLFLNLF